MEDRRLWAEYDRLVEAGDFEAARRLLDEIPPLSHEEWRNKFDAAPMDDEPVSEELLRRFEDFEARRLRTNSLTAG